MKLLPSTTQDSDKTLLSSLLTSELHKDNNHSDDTFMITEYVSITDLWKHTDGRMESGVNIYLTTNTLVISAMAFFSQSISDINLFLFITALVAIALATTGRILCGRLLGTAFNKAEYLYARDLIRRYFANRYPSIESFLYFLRSSNNSIVGDPHETNVNPRVPYTIIATINLWVSILFGYTITALLYVIFPNQEVSIMSIMGLSSSLLLLIYYVTNLRRQINHFRIRKHL